jgi:hypothetical protein
VHFIGLQGLHFLAYSPGRAKLLIKPRAVERLLLPDDDDGIQFASLKDLCFEALKHFSQTALTSHRRKLDHAPGATRPEAQYVYELYRCLYHITGGKSVVHSEYSYTVPGRIDLFLKNRRWGIEALKDGDRMSKHIHRCSPKGVYGSWGIASEYIILNFCAAPPKTKLGSIIIHRSKNISLLIMFC